MGAMFAAGRWWRQIFFGDSSGIVFTDYFKKREEYDYRIILHVVIWKFWNRKIKKMSILQKKESAVSSGQRTCLHFGGRKFISLN